MFYDIYDDKPWMMKQYVLWIPSHQDLRAVVRLRNQDGGPSEHFFVKLDKCEEKKLRSTEKVFSPEEG